MAEEPEVQGKRVECSKQVEEDKRVNKSSEKVTQ